MGVNGELAAIFERTAQLVELTGGNTFRAVAFQRAARALEALPDDVGQMARSEKPIAALTSISGIGKGLAEKIIEYVNTGRIAEVDELAAQVPPGVTELLNIPGLGPKTIALFWKEAGITSLEQLKAKLATDELAKLPRMGLKKIEAMRKSIGFAESAGARVLLGRALPMGQWFVNGLQAMKGVKQAQFAGSLRRGRETIGDVDLVAAVGAKDAPAVAEAFVKLEPVTEVLVRGVTKTSVRVVEHMQVDLRIVEPHQYGAALLYFTGSKEHNVRLRERAIRMGMSLNEYALTKGEEIVAGNTEEEVYRALGLAWIPPELREDRGEIALAEKGKLPTLIEIGDIKAELHAHTRASDGKWSIRELAAAAAERGFHTVAVTDHSKGQVQANGLTAERLEQHIVAVRKVAAELKGTITVLAGSEVDILTDGSLDYPNSLLKELDIVVASPHAALTQDPKKATDRLLRAIHSPYVTIIGHATGRLLPRREGLAPDMKQVLAAAAERGIAMEINANSYRLDLRDLHARAAIEAGVKSSINTDAHGPADLDQLIFGILTARRAGARKEDVVNAMSRETLARWIKGTRS